MSAPEWLNVALWVVPVAEIGAYQRVMARCACGRTSEVPIDAVRRHLRPTDQIRSVAPKLRCSGCGGKRVQYVWVRGLDRG